jgi:type VI protein secretion system component VasF
MSTPTADSDEKQVLGSVRLPLHRRVTFAGFALLVVLAVVFYLWWGLSYGRWFDNGVYAVTIVLALFGLVGIWLISPNPPAPPPPHP